VEGFKETPDGEGESVPEAINDGLGEEREDGVSEVDRCNGHVSKYFKIIIVKDFTCQSLGRNKSHI
jgi:hypothetical protein